MGMVLGRTVFPGDFSRGGQWPHTEGVGQCKEEAAAGPPVTSRSRIVLPTLVQMC